MRGGRLTDTSPRLLSYSGVLCLRGRSNILRLFMMVLYSCSILLIYLFLLFTLLVCALRCMATYDEAVSRVFCFVITVCLAMDLSANMTAFVGRCGSLSYFLLYVVLVFISLEWFLKPCIVLRKDRSRFSVYGITSFMLSCSRRFR